MAWLPHEKALSPLRFSKKGLRLSKRSFKEILIDKADSARLVGLAHPVLCLAKFL
jgi:hypothetical protein